MVEPCSLRQNQDGNLLLSVVGDHGELKEMRTNRIAGVCPTRPSAPGLRVEW